MMSATMLDEPKPLPRPPVSVVPAGFDWPAFLLVAAGFLLLYGWTYWDLAHSVWATDEQGHGPIILAVSWWLIYQRRHEVAALAARPATAVGAVLMAFGLLLYSFGRSQAIWIFEVGSQIVMLASLLLLFKGWSALRLLWFPLFFQLFMVPLPEALVASVTGPLKSAVSSVASALLYDLGYPVGRSGVTLTVGQYQLLVADACAGLNSMFTLEALGMLYMNIMRYTSVSRNVTLALLLVPISFASNIIRVMILVLVTYHLAMPLVKGSCTGLPAWCCS